LRRALGYLPQDFGVYPHLTGYEFLSYLAAVKGLTAKAARARVDELLDLVGLGHSAYVGTVTALSGALWFVFAGFYVVRQTVARDETTRAGQVLAATPIRGAAYLVGEFLSSLIAPRCSPGTAPSATPNSAWA
jgi:hypothetical protein